MKGWVKKNKQERYNLSKFPISRHGVTYTYTQATTHGKVEKRKSRKGKEKTRNLLGWIEEDMFFRFLCKSHLMTHRALDLTRFYSFDSPLDDSRGKIKFFLIFMLSRVAVKRKVYIKVRVKRGRKEKCIDIYV